MKQAEEKKQAAMAAFLREKAVAEKKEAEEAPETELSLLEIDPKSLIAATKRTKGDNARFGKFMALQRKKAAYGAMQRTLQKQAEAKKQAAIAAYLSAHAEDQQITAEVKRAEAD